MGFKMLVLVLNIITFLGVYVIYTGGTLASVCRDAGHAVVAVSIDEGDSGTLPGARAWVSNVGRSTIDTCTIRH